MARSTPRPTGKAFGEAAAAAAWRKAAPGRAAFLAMATERLLEAAGIGPGSRVLVVGGGTGDEAIEAARRSGPEGEVVLTDLSEPMVREARLVVAEAGHPEIRCLKMDVQSLDFRNGEFDAVLARNVLMFVPELPRALAEIRRVLRPGGRLAATTWSAGGHNPRLAIPVEAARAVGVAVPPEATIRLAVSLSRPDRLRATLRRAGFTGLEVQAVDATARPADWEAFLEDLRQHVGTREVAGLVPEALRERFWQALARRFQVHREAGALPGELLVTGATNPGA